MKPLQANCPFVIRKSTEAKEAFVCDLVYPETSANTFSGKALAKS